MSTSSPSDMPRPRRYEPTGRAIELMASWLDSPDGQPELLLEELRRHVEAHPSQDRLVAATELIMGMTHLCGSLLVLREFEIGAPAKQTLGALALYAQDPARGPQSSWPGPSR